MRQYKYPKALIELIKKGEKTATCIFRSLVNDRYMDETKKLIGQIIEVINDEDIVDSTAITHV